MFKPRKYQLLLAGIAWLSSAAPAIAAIFDPSHDLEAPSQLPGLIYDGNWVEAGELYEVVKLLKEEKRDAAKQKLGTYMRQHKDDPRALELAAMLLMEDGKLETAETSLTRAILLDPRRNSAIVKLGVVLLLEDKRRGAEIAFSKALENNPAEPLALRYLAYLEQRRGRTPAVIDYLERLLQTDWVDKNRVTEVHLVLAQSYNAVEAYRQTGAILTPLVLDNNAPDPNSAGAFTLLAALLGDKDIVGAQRLIDKLYQNPEIDRTRVALDAASLDALKGNKESAIKALRKIASNRPEQAGAALYRIALIHRADEKWSDVARELKAAADAAAPEEVGTVLRELSAAYLAAGTPKLALSTLDEFAAKHPDNDAIGYLQAEVEAKTGNLEAARVKLLLLTGRNDRHSAAYYLLGVIEWQLGHVDLARTAVRRVVTIKPDDIQGWLTLAGMYDAHQVETAMAVGRKKHASGQDGGHGDAHGDASSNAHDHGSHGAEPHSHGDGNPMVDILEEALQLNPDHPDLLYERATLAYADGDVRNAQEFYENVLKRVPEHVPALNNLALSIVQSSDQPQRAEPLISKAQRLAPQNPAVLDTLGWYMVRTGRLPEAVKILEAVAQAVPDDPMVNYHLGIAYWESKRVQEAAKLIEAALAHGLPALEAVEANVVLQKAKRHLREG
jgi:tetratricopeptide (TPR) repeat protein